MDRRRLVTRVGPRGFPSSWLRRTLRGVAVGAILVASMPGLAVAAGPEMTVHVLFAGHARTGSWMPIEVHLENDGPSIVGEVRIVGGSEGQTRYGLAVDLPTQSSKDYTLYAQPPTFGQSLKVALVAGDEVLAQATVQFTPHEASQLLVGIVAERPDRIRGGLRLPSDVSGRTPVILGLSPADLPEEAVGWATLDRLIWQDVDAASLTSRQLDALAAWLAQGGHLVIVGGTAGPAALAGFPDDLLPFRPSGTIDIDPEGLRSFLGDLPDAAATLPAMTGRLERGVAIVRSGDQVVAAVAPHGIGSVALVGFDPTTGWLAESRSVESLWRRLVPDRSNAAPISRGEDTLMLSAVSQLPALELPPVGGLIALLGGYVLLVGPINYLVLRRIDRREWAWLTIPALIAVFTVGAYAFGSLLRGVDVIVNEISIVRGGVGATEGTATAYLGIFSPTRRTYQLEVGGGALLSSPISGGFLGGDGITMDVLQGDPARVRDLAVGFASLRAVRADSVAEVPALSTDLTLRDGILSGTVTNESDQPIEKVAIVLGWTATTIGDLGPGETKAVTLRIDDNGQFGATLSDQIFGGRFFDPVQNDTSRRNEVRRTMVDQLTYDPFFGQPTDLSDAGPVVLAFGNRPVLDVRIESLVPQRTGETLYVLPTRMTASGPTSIGPGLFRPTVLTTDSLFFNKSPGSFNLSQGSAAVAYRPIGFEGTLAPTRLAVAIGAFQAAGVSRTGQAISPVAVPPVYCLPEGPIEGCVPAPSDGLPEVDVFDLTNSAWVRLPHLKDGQTYDLEEPARYVDPSSATVLFRFVNEAQPETYFGLALRVDGTVR